MTNTSSLGSWTSRHIFTAECYQGTEESELRSMSTGKDDDTRTQGLRPLDDSCASDWPLWAIPRLFAIYQTFYSP
jgi:hypothetical protein